MAFHVRDTETDTLVRKLASKRGVGLTEAVKQAVGAELAREEAKTPLRERVRDIQEAFAAMPGTGLSADKAFFDSLSGEED